MSTLTWFADSIFSFRSIKEKLSFITRFASVASAHAVREPFLFAEKRVTKKA